MGVNKNLLGSILVLVSAAGFGIMGIAAKIAYAEGANAVSVLVMRYITATLLMWIYNALTGRLNRPVKGDSLPGSLHWAAFSCCDLGMFLLVAKLYTRLRDVHGPIPAPGAGAHMLIFAKKGWDTPQPGGPFMAFSGTAMVVWAPGIYINFIGVALRWRRRAAIRCT